MSQFGSRYAETQSAICGDFIYKIVRCDPCAIRGRTVHGSIDRRAEIYGGRYRSTQSVDQIVLHLDVHHFIHSGTILFGHSSLDISEIEGLWCMVL